MAGQILYSEKNLLWHYRNLKLNKLSHNVINVVWHRSITGEILFQKSRKFDLKCLCPILRPQLSKVFFFFLATEWLFLYVDYRLCHSSGAINIYQNQLYLLELRKIHLTTLMSVKKQLQRHRGKEETRPKHGQKKITRGIFHFFFY